MLRPYENVEQYIRECDMPISAVAYSPSRGVCMSLTSCISLASGVVIVDPKRRRREGYEYRICKYVDRGYLFLFPSLDLEQISAEEAAELRAQDPLAFMTQRGRGRGRGYDSRMPTLEIKNMSLFAYGVAKEDLNSKEKVQVLRRGWGDQMPVMGRGGGRGRGGGTSAPGIRKQLYFDGLPLKDGVYSCSSKLVSNIHTACRALLMGKDLSHHVVLQAGNPSDWKQLKENPLVMGIDMAESVIGSVINDTMYYKVLDFFGEEAGLKFIQAKFRKDTQQQIKMAKERAAEVRSYLESCVEKGFRFDSSVFVSQEMEPRDWYPKDKYTPTYNGNKKLETELLLLRSKHPGFKALPRDVFRMLFETVMLQDALWRIGKWMNACGKIPRPADPKAREWPPDNDPDNVEDWDGDAVGWDAPVDLPYTNVEWNADEVNDGPNWAVEEEEGEKEEQEENN